MFAIPKDIYPESGFRLPLPDRDEMDNEEKAIYDKVIRPGPHSIAGIGIKGPLGINLQNPRLAELESALNRYLRFSTGLSVRTRELAILVTAREMDSRFEWAAHETIAIKEGLESEIIDVIKYRKRLTGMKEEDAVIVQLGREMFGKHRVTAKTFGRALKTFGKKSLVNLVALMAYYSATAAKLCAFENQVSSDQPHLPVS
ncbi:carboxymuconolactone decarboxylase family protein [Chloroflexota bacterium]